MIDEPYRWVEAIANRREYIENELAGGSPIIGVSCPEGQLLLTFGRDRRKIFEIYDRIAMSGIGHPGDIERLRMMALELASAEGFTRSAEDVSVRRMVTYSFSPAFKQAFEQIYGAPYLARLLFAEVSHEPETDLFMRLDYDGTISANAAKLGQKSAGFGVIAGTTVAGEAAERSLRDSSRANSLNDALVLAIRAWVIARLTTGESEHPSRDAVKNFLNEQLENYSIEAVLLDRAHKRITFGEVQEDQVNAALDQLR
jgi:proteasome alpha subunit